MIGPRKKLQTQQSGVPSEPEFQGIDFSKESQYRLLRDYLLQQESAAIAVSGGVDSMTLAVFAHRLLRPHVVILHAVSPAVPPESTRRVRRYAAREGWDLKVFYGGEFEDPGYLENPSNRCFFCKSHLYDAIRQHTAENIYSGTNMDDLDDFRPGLDAARERGVGHPFVEAGIDKKAVRRLARLLQLTDLADLPAAPCLASRVETGIRIESSTLEVIHAVETLVTKQLNPATVRCRVRRNAVVVELDEASLKSLSEGRRSDLTRQIQAILGERDLLQPLYFSEYRMGSAFLPPDPTVTLET